MNLICLTKKYYNNSRICDIPMFIPILRPFFTEITSLIQGLFGLAANQLRPATVAVSCSQNRKISNFLQQPSPLRQSLQPVTSVNQAFQTMKCFTFWPLEEILTRKFEFVQKIGVKIFLGIVRNCAKKVFWLRRK